jgi:hypothetical protein
MIVMKYNSLQVYRYYKVYYRHYKYIYVYIYIIYVCLDISNLFAINYKINGNMNLD